MKISYRLLATGMLAIVSSMTFAVRPIDTLRRTDMEFLNSAEAARIAEQVLAYQRITGGWPKNIDMCRPHTGKELEEVLADRSRADDSTTDNFATTTQLKFIANMFQATGEGKFQEAFRCGVEYLLSGQYENGGWPQFWPDPQGYQEHITFNDGAMANTMILLRDIALQVYPYSGDLVDDDIRFRSKTAFDNGVECILATQIRVGGIPTVWCQQHDRVTFAPATARTYELPSFCSQESAQIVSLLMQIPDPDERIRNAVHGAMKWFDDNKLMGFRIERTGEKNSPDAETRLIADKEAGPLWGRFYDLENCEIFVCDRDGIPKRRLEEIGRERRNGYSWYNDHPATLYNEYDKWVERYDPTGKQDIRLK